VLGTVLGTGVLEAGPDQRDHPDPPCGQESFAVLRRYVEVMTAPTVEVRRSARRRRTVSAYREGDTIVVLLPARMTEVEEAHWVEVMLAKIQRRSRRQPNDSALSSRALELSERYLDGLARPTSVRWVDNQFSRWGSCTVADGSVRLSQRLQVMPGWVVDYVLIHELAHLLVPDHGHRFWEWVNRYPRTERARGFLEGVSAAAGLPDAELGDAED